MEALQGFHKDVVRPSHQDQGRTAELDLSRLCVSAKEVFLPRSLHFPGRIQISSRRELSVFPMFWVFQRWLEIDSSY